MRAKTEYLHKNRGQAMVEMALVLPVLLLLVVGMMEFGLVFKTYQEATEISRAGARAYAVGATIPLNDTRRAAAAAAYQTVVANGNNYNPPLTVSPSALPADPSTITHGKEFYVEVTGNVTIITPMMRLILGNPTHPVKAKTTMIAE